MQDVESFVAPDVAVGVQDGPGDPVAVGTVGLAIPAGIVQSVCPPPDAREIAPVGCKRHSRYRGLRRPQNGCAGCMALYNYARATGVRETRKRRSVPA
jgi:hypothetical protein